MADTVRQVMTKDPIEVDAGSPIQEVAGRMRDEDVGNILVTEGSELKGIVTDRDIVIRAIAEGKDTSQATVGEICSGELRTVEPDTSVGDAIRLMTEASVRRLPVVENGRPVGVVAIGDLAVEEDTDSALADISADSPNN